jgi:serine/threonine protein kinase
MDGFSSIEVLPATPDEARPPARLARGTQPRDVLEASGPRASDGEPFGPYIVHERLGAGGMATVHRAEQRGIAGFSKPIALKRMFEHLAEDPSFLQALVQEAQLVARLRHDNIAQAYDFGKVNDTYYIAMELVTGPTLQQLMNGARSGRGEIPIPIIIEILIQLCDALDHAHNLCDDAGVPLGIIHRDVSPSNVIISNAGMVKLIDFGIAKALSSQQRTSAGIIKGKFGYIAPEYTRGQLDARADLFALGVIAHELLSGQRLFRGDSDFATLVAVREKEITKPSSYNRAVSSDLDDIVMTALQRDPELRWQSASAMRTALAAIARTLGVVVGGQRMRDWVERAAVTRPSPEDPSIEPKIETVSACLEVSQPSMIIELYPAPPPSPRAADPTISLRSPSPAPGDADPFTTPATTRTRPRTRRFMPALLLLGCAGLGIAAWQVWPAVMALAGGG